MAKKARLARKARRAREFVDAQTVAPPVDIDSRSLFVRICDHIAEKGIYAIIVFVPLAFLPDTYWLFDVTRVTFLRALSILILTAYLARMAASREWKFIRPPVVWPIIAYLAVYAISSIFSISPALSVYSGEGRNFGLISLANMLLLYFLVFNILTDRKQLLLCLHLLVASSCVVALFGILQFYGKSPHLMSEMYADRASSTFGNPDFLISFMVFPIAVAFAFVLQKKWFYLPPLLFLLFCFTLTVPYQEFSIKGIEGYWILFIGGSAFLGLLAAFAYLPKPYIRRYSVIFVTMVIVVFGLVLGNVFDMREKVWNFTDVHVIGWNSDTDRYQLRQIAWDGLDSGKDWAIGTGPNTFRDTFTKYATVEYTQIVDPDRREDKVHNSFVEAAATTGILGLVSYLVMLGAIVWYFMRKLAKTRGTPEFIMAAMILISGLIYILFSLTLFHTVIPYTFFWLLMAFGMALVGAKELQSKTWKLSISKAFSWFLVAMVFALGGWGIFESARPLQANVEYFKGLKILLASNNAEVDKALPHLKRAKQLNGAEVRYHFQYAYALYAQGVRLQDAEARNRSCLEIDAVMTQALDLEPESAMLYYHRANLRDACGYWDGAVSDAYKAVELYPYGYLPLKLLADFETRMGRLEEAIAHDTVSLIIQPGTQQDLIRLGTNYIRLGDQYSERGDVDSADEHYAQAVDILEQTAELYPKDVTAHWYLGTAYEKVGNQDRADQEYQTTIEMLGKLLESQPENVDAHYLLGSAYQAVGDIEKAKEAYRAALELDPNHGQAKDALEKLEAGDQ